jgi:hypothetical protein
VQDHEPLIITAAAAGNGKLVHGIIRKLAVDDTNRPTCADALATCARIGIESAFQPGLPPDAWTWMHVSAVTQQ